MTTSRNRFRDVAKVVVECLWPGDPVRWREDKAKSLRYEAIAEVLCCIPEGDYEKLGNKIDSFHWFIPGRHVTACLHSFAVTVADPPAQGESRSTKAASIDPKTGCGREEAFQLQPMKPCPYATVLYLSPRLERAAYDSVLASVAHELAHIVLGHKLLTKSDQLYTAQEEEVLTRLCEWGFEEQARELLAVNKRMGSRDGF